MTNKTTTTKFNVGDIVTIVSDYVSVSDFTPCEFKIDCLNLRPSVRQ